MAVAIDPISWWKRFPFPSLTSTTFTFCTWCRPDRVPGASNQEYVWFLDNFSGSNASALVFTNASSSPRLEAWQNGASRVVGPTVSTGTWVFGAYVCTSGTTVDMYWRLEGASSLSTGSGSTGSTPSILEFLFGSDRSFSNAQCFDGAYRHGRYWDGTALSSAQLLSESASATPVLQAYGAWPFENITNDTTDISGNPDEPQTLEWNTGVGGAQSDTSDPTIALPSGGPPPLRRRANGLVFR